nr:nucleotide-binding alpha-beta plait domain-containing protein [Tanacetum cinerariifolium]
MGDIKWTEVRRKNRKPVVPHRNGLKSRDYGWTRKYMGKVRTKEDDVARISTSVNISNIPESVSAKDLFQACKQYGHVVDSFIPFKRDKNGNRFRFVRFLNVFNTERLVNNLCTVWIDRYKIQANIAHSQRMSGNGAKSEYKNGEDASNRNLHSTSNVNSKVINNSWGDKSYMGAVKCEKQSSDVDLMSNAALVLGDECMMSKDLSLALLGRVKEFASLANLEVVIGNEGFEEISIKIAWVEVEGILLKLWSGNTFRRIAAKWGKFLDVDDQEDSFYHSKRICIYMKSGRFIKDEFKIIHREDDEMDETNSNEDDYDTQMAGGVDIINTGNVEDKDREVEMAQETCLHEEEPGIIKDEGDTPIPHTDKSEDPFNLYPLLNNPKTNVESNLMSGESLKLPPGFTPTFEKNEDNLKEDVGHNFQKSTNESKDNKEKLEDVVSSIHVNQNKKEVRIESSSSGHFKKSECPKKDGSIIGVLEEIIKVGQVMGYNIEGCISNMGEINSSKGVDEVVEGDENSKLFHGMLNKKRNTLSIRRVLVDGVWVDDLKGVKREFYDQFSKRFGKPDERHVNLCMDFPNRLQSDQRCDLEADVTNDEIKRAVWECGMDKASGPDGFTFGFFRQFWYLVDKDLFDAVRYFFLYDDIPRGCSSSFIALIPKIPDANLVKDFRPISLIGSIYKIIDKILSNRLVNVLGGLVNEVQSAFVANR